ncbi:sugar phosphate isomerase/epimerase [Paenibacillus sp. GYB004]|uniref:sugar phosphate isomerase/epimerase family protein n=1 Tax=Paenibacillus sp. GYB004 TaxID=2994393 RepID=UPI002F963A76
MRWEQVGVITDEVSERFSEALDWIAAQGLHNVELRMIDGKNISSLTNEELQTVSRDIRSRGLLVSAIASPLFKCKLDPSRQTSHGDVFGHEEESPERHLERLPRLIEMAQTLDTSMIRVFSFWREKEPERYNEDIAAYLSRAAELAGRSRTTLLLENEGSCNCGTARETGEMADRVNSPWLRIVWDPGNEAYLGLRPFPDGYEAVKKRLAHVHLKDTRRSGDGRFRGAPIGRGVVPWKEQFAALERDGYKGIYVIETHYKPDSGSIMDGSRESLEGLRQVLSSC